MTAWRLRGVQVRYRGGLLRARGPAVLAGLDLEVAAGERVAVIGASGAGKSTLARAGLGLLPLDAGHVELLGEDTRGWGRRDWQRARRHAQLLLQDPAAMLHPEIPVGLLLRESAALHRPGADARAEAASMLDAVGLGGRGDALPRELSGGERRRAGLARVLLARPRLLVADEPTDGLDAAARVEMLELLLDRVGPACAVVWITHDLDAVAWAVDRVLVLDGGRITDALPASDLTLGARALLAASEGP